MEHNMVLSYDYSNRNRRWRQMNAPPSQAISMAMAVRRCNTAGIAWRRRSWAFKKKPLNAAIGWLLSPYCPGDHQGDNQQNNDDTIYYLCWPFRWMWRCASTMARITRWRRFMAFLKATKRRHRASTHSYRIKGTLQCREFTIFWE